MIFAFTFLNPMLLWAVPLAAVPVVIHLLNRRRFQQVSWAAMEYLLKALERNRKRLRMEQWLVLLLRTLAVLLLVMLVSRPQLGGGGLVSSVTHHVVVLDDTASMRQRSGSVALWDKAQDQVRRLATSLAESRSGDLLSILRASRPSQPDLWAQRVGEGLERRVQTVLSELGVGDGTADFGSVLHDARARAVAMKDASRTDYYLVGDMRSIDWIGDDDKPRGKLLQTIASFAAEDEHLHVMGVGSRDADNLAIVGVRCVDRMATAGVPVELAVDVHNLGLDATAAGELAIEVDGKTRVARPLPPLAPGERVSVPVVHTFLQSGDHRVEASFVAVDHYLVDDRRTLALPVQASSRVLLVDGEPEDGEGGETLFLQVALDPGGDQPSGIAVEVVAESSLAEVDLSPFDMVFLCNVPVPTRSTIERLEQFSAQGGGIAIFVGAQVDPVRYTDSMWRGGQGLLPLPLGEIAGDPDRRERVVLTDQNHPVCGKIGDVLQLMVDNAVLVKRYLTILEDAGTSAAVIARMRDTDGPPAIVSRTFGSGGGEVVLFAFSADKHWSNWPDTDLNVVMAHQVHRFASRPRELASRNLQPDGVYRLQLDPGSYEADVVVRAIAEDGDERTFSAQLPEAPVQPAGATGTEAAPRALELSLPMTELTSLGGYEVRLALHSGNVETRAFARNPDIVESRLVRLSSADFTRVFPPDLHDRVTFRDESAGLASGGGEGELWRLIGLGMLLALLLETLLAWRFGRR
ncbi:MAG: BatA domain-containing protein [Planctomycetota bacterium]